jgi:Tol biopolymer transport system component
MGLLHGIALLATFTIAVAETSGALVIRQADAWRNHIETTGVAVSSDGRFVAFVSYARLLPVDTNQLSDIYVFDARSGHVTLESIAKDGRRADAGSFHPSLSADGRIVAFDSTARNLVDRPVRGGQSHIYVRDRARGETRLVSVGIDGAMPDGGSFSPSISGDGATVAFESNATNLVDAPDTNSVGADVYIADLARETIERVSVNSAGEQAPLGTSFTPSLSADGMLVAFTSTADIECAGDAAACPPWCQDTNGLPDVYVRNRRDGSTRRLTRGADGDETLAPSHHPALSRNGRFVAFVSAAENLVANDQNRADDVFLQNLETGETTLVSRRAGGGAPGNGRSLQPDVSADGQLVGFQSTASDLVCARRCAPADVDDNDTWDVFLFDAGTGRTTRVSATPGGQAWRQPSAGVRLDAAGRLVAFQSREPGGAHDRRKDYDLFVRWMRGFGGPES